MSTLFCPFHSVTDTTIDDIGFRSISPTFGNLITSIVVNEKGKKKKGF